MNNFNRITAIILCLMITVTFCSFPVFAGTETELENVARGKEATSNWASAGTVTANAVDGNKNTQFISAQDPSVFCLDLGGTYSISKIVMKVPVASGYDFTRNVNIHLSKKPVTDGTVLPSQKTTILTTDAGGWETKDIKTIDLADAVTARYVIVEKPQRADNNDSLRIQELEVYGVAVEDDTEDDDTENGDTENEDNENNEPTNENIAFGKPATANWNSAGTVPSAAVDGDVNTPFVSAQDPAVFCLDLEGTYSISKIVMKVPVASGYDFSRNVNIHLSKNPVTDKTVLPTEKTTVLTTDTSGWDTPGEKVIELSEAVSARYVIVEKPQRADTHDSLRISELEVYGVEVEDDTGNDGNLIEVNVALKKSATANWESAGTVPSNAVDGDMNTPFVSAMDPSVYCLDLGGSYPISKIVVKIPVESGRDYSRNVNVHLSQDSVISGTVLPTEKTTVLTTDASGWDTPGEKIIELTEALNTRYVIVEKPERADTHDSLRISELEVYVNVTSYLDGFGKDIALIDKQSSVSATEISYNADVLNGKKNNSIIGLFGKGNLKGKYSETAYAAKEVEKVGIFDVTLSASVSDDGKWEAFVLSGLEYIKGFSDIAKLTEIPQSEAEEGVEPTISQLGNNITVTGGATGSVVGMVIIKKGADFENYTDEDILTHGVCYAPAGNDGVWNFSFDYSFEDELPVGEYKIGFFCDNNDSAISEKVLTVEKIDLDTVVDAFEDVTEENFEALVEANRDFFGDTADELIDSETMAKSFILAKSAVEQGMFDKNINGWNGNALTATTFAAMVIDKTMHSTDFSEEIAPYIGSMPDIFGKDYDAEEFEQIFEVVRKKAEIDDAQSLVDAYKKANILSVIAGGDVEDIEKAIAENSTLLGIKESTLKSITPLQIAKRLDPSMKNVLDRCVDGMDEVVSEIAKELNSSKPSGSGSVGGGSSGGKGGSGVIATSGTGGSLGVGNSAVNNKEDSLVVFLDIADFGWAADAIRSLAQKGIINGKGNGMFDPAGVLTREEAVKILVSATGLPTDEQHNSYEDCVVGSWYYPYITAAKMNDLVNGISRTEFGLGRPVSRQDLAVMIYRDMVKKGIAERRDSVEFTDAAEISDYAVEAVAVLNGMKIITGFEDGRFAPGANATRAETAVIFERYLKFVECTKTKGEGE